MKKTKYFVVSAVLAAGLALSACATSENEAEIESQDTLAATETTPAAETAPDATTDLAPEDDPMAGFLYLEHTPGALANQLAPPAPGEEFAIVRTNHGDIHVRLFHDLAPLTVENFTTHARNGFYDGIIFHRIIENFMVQGGDPLGTGAGGESIWGAPFGDELTTNLRNIRGALSMANAGPSTNGSQFFFVHNAELHLQTVAEMEYYLEMQDEEVMDQFGTPLGYYVRDIWPAEFMQHYIEHGGTPHLDLLHAVFGQVFEGMDVVDAIAAVQVGQNDRPLEDVIIYTIDIVSR